MDFTPSEKFQIFQDTNKYAAEYARYAISFAFYLNGAAATAIFAAGKTECQVPPAKPGACICEPLKAAESWAA